VSLLVEKDVAPDPIDISLLGADAVMFDPQVPTDAVEELWSACTIYLLGGSSRTRVIRQVVVRE
jgi:hypothetical protein